MKSAFPSSNRGSALLIVLGLLSFLMISAVAFSISMRTERTAAAAYRRGLMARELLDNAFVDARATVEHALRDQQGRDGSFDVRNPSTRTVENLAPFRYPSSDDHYGRVLVSYDPAESDDIAYLLDEAVMRHIPPYIAYSVYMYLEKNESVVEGDGDTTGNALYSYKLDTSAGWKPITVDIPDTEKDIDGEDTSKATVGRMAWAVVNLSDSLDLNAIGSASTYRGIGLTANEFAFGTAATGSTAPSELFDLIETSTSPDGSEVADLPIFCSNADIARYTAKVSGSTPLVVDNGNEFPYAWQDAVDNEGDGFYSPFSCYSFWPNAERDGEGSADRRSAASSSSSATTEDAISCNDVKQSAIQDTGSELSSEIQERVGAAAYLGNDDAGQNFVRLLLDYVDNDATPAHYQTDAQKDLFANAQPTVENVPMVSEVGYDASVWQDEKTKSDFQEAVKDGLDDINLNAFTPVNKLEDLALNLNGTDLELKLPAVELNLALRAYFPGYETTTERYDITPVGFVGVVAAGALESGSELEATPAVGTTELKVSGTSFTADNGSDVFTDTGAQPSIVAKPSKEMEVTFKGDNIPVTYQKPTEITSNVTPPAKQNVTLSFLVDYFFRVDVTAGSDVVDRCPTDKGLGPEFDKTNYVTSLNNRFAETQMKRLDAQYFRVTVPVSATFALQWKLKVNVNSQDNSQTEIEYEGLEVVDDKIDVKIDLNSDFKMANLTFKGAGDATTASYQVLSPERGAWFTVDPRYNWLSPMLGLSSGSASAYGTQQAIRANLSSPHWLFVEDQQITTGTNASEIQEDYATANENLVPFLWGLKVEDIRYGQNDSGQLLLPGEVGFLPVPLPTSTWHPNEYGYKKNSIDSYYNNVAKQSFFRTIPMVDLKDGAVSDNDYEKFANLCKFFGSFAGENFPEEHRGLVNVFAAQDNYYLAQQLRQFAMLGIPASIKQAAKVTFDRLKAAETVKKVSKEMVTDLESTIGSVEIDSLQAPKYDEFVTDYLFPLPETGGKRGRRDWNGEHKLYKGGETAQPARPKTLDFIVQDNGQGDTFADRLAAYNDTKAAGEKLGQNDMTTLLSVAKECFGDRQQLFLYILRADAIAYNSGRDLAKFRPLSTARAVALVWRDAYGELPDRVIYYQVLP